MTGSEALGDRAPAGPGPALPRPAAGPEHAVPRPAADPGLAVPRPATDRRPALPQPSAGRDLTLPQPDPAKAGRRDGRSGLRGRRMMVAAVLVDTFGSGAFYPLTFLYLRLTTELPLSQIGLLMSGSALAALLGSPLAGALVDRAGARRALLATNALCIAGYLDLLVARHPLPLAAGLLALSCAERIYWVAWPVFLIQQVDEDAIDRWIALTNALKSAAVGAGALVAAAALAAGSTGALRIVLLGNAATSLFAAVVFARLPDPVPSDPVPSDPELPGPELPGPEPSGPGPSGSGPSGSRTAAPGAPPDTDPAPALAPGRSGVRLPRPDRWRTLLHDRPYLALVGSQAALAFAWLLPSVVLPLYLVDTLGLPKWIAPCVYAINTVMIVTLQPTVTRALGPYRRTRAVLLGTALFLASFVLYGLTASVGRGAAVALASAGMVLFSLGEMAAGPGATALALVASPAELRGRYSALFQMAWAVSSVSGPALVGAALQHGGPVLWIVLGTVVALGGAGFTGCERLLPAHVLAPRTEEAAL
ncbi:MFS transporter [Peterkaempfera sp. SMS 1(5)a]|uniref:MFS transporter n=1 Tax=Peterkaempfera podocarpi TaxID=3232308 RepID=UPI003671CB18